MDKTLAGVASNAGESGFAGRADEGLLLVTGTAAIKSYFQMPGVGRAAHGLVVYGATVRGIENYGLPPERPQLFQGVHGGRIEIEFPAMLAGNFFGREVWPGPFARIAAVMYENLRHAASPWVCIKHTGGSEGGKKVCRNFPALVIRWVIFPSFG